jgi:DNA modification methylase
MDGQKADMVFTDPPYNVDYGVSKNPRHKIRSIHQDNQTPKEWESFNEKIINNIKGVVDEGDIYVWGASGEDGMRQRLWFIDNDFHWSATIIWKKQQLVLSPAKYQRMYEPCLYGWFNKSSFVADRKQTEVWEIDRPLNSKLHPTMKPIDLCTYGIKNSSKVSSKVLDLFLGSGSTLIACEKTNRKCYGMEIDPHYCDVIVERWENFTGKKAKKK